MSSVGVESLGGGAKPQKGAQKVIPFGKYLLLERISVGGMAEVFKAKAFGVEGFERIIAIKRILPTMAEDEEFIEMFIDEAKIVGQLSHSNIVPIYELGRIGDSHFIAMEFVWGKDLLQIMNRHRRLRQHMPGPMAAWIGSRICEGLDYAHRKRDADGKNLEIIHRDVSPQNVIVSYEGEVKLIDFGIAKAAHRQTRTQAGVLKGKFGYMSPEQVRGLPLDRRSDVFAVGTCMYEMLTSERLFLGESDFSTLEKVRNADVDPPSKFNSAIPRELEDIVMKALSRDSDDRFHWASEMQEALQRYLLTVKPLFNAQKLAQFMKSTFSVERKSEKERMDEHARIGRDRLAGSVPPPLPGSASPSIPPPIPRDATGAGARPAIGGAVTGDWDRKTPLLDEPDAEAVDIEVSEDEDLHYQPTQIGASPSDGDSLTGREIAAQPTTIFFSNEDALLASPSSPSLPSSPEELPAAPTVILSEDDEALRPIEEVMASGASGVLERREAMFPAAAAITPMPMPVSQGASGAGLKLLVAALALVVLGLATFVVVDRLGPGFDGGLKATLVVAARPVAEADVLVDGQARGRTPLKIDGLEPRIYAVTVIAPGYRPSEQAVTLGAGAVELVVGLLEPAAAQGALRVDVTAPGSRVLVDGVLVPPERLASIPVGAGPHHIEVAAPGFVPEDFDVTIVAGGLETRAVTLREQKGSLVVGSVPEGATVILDGRERGRTPMVVDGLDFAVHHVALRLEGHRAHLQDVTLTREAPTAQVNAALEPGRDPAERGQGGQEGAEYGTLIISTNPIARILIDGVDTGRTTPVVPNNPLRLRPGAHRVTFKLPSGETFDYSANIRVGEQSRLTGIRLGVAPAP
ncbi:MAG: serine/threonine protein kinase [Deltaproteobacteria bacterium]|nr:serine/threonine protein kinase [Deltaproteobacteria bacterium]